MESLNLLCVLISIILTEARVAEGSQPDPVDSIFKRKEIIASEAREMLYDDTFSCTTPKRKMDKLLHFSRHPRNPIQEVNFSYRSDNNSRLKRETEKLVNKHLVGKESFGRAVYFDGQGKILRLRFQSKNGKIELPNGAFTVMFWIRPEGGQQDGASVVDLFDECSRKSTNGRWMVGIRPENGGTARAKFTFLLRTESSSSDSTLFSDKTFRPDTWSHVAATYDGDTMKLYINGAKVAVGSSQKGNIFSETDRKCKDLLLGGDFVRDAFYRGEMDKFSLFKIALDHKDIIDCMFSISERFINGADLIISDDFQDLKTWRSKRGNLPEIGPSSMPLVSHDMHFEAPPCGETVCDDPEAVFSYRDNPELRNEKVIRYRVINLMNDDGTKPVVTNEQIRVQHKALLKAFEPYNITFDLNQVNIRNTSLRERVIMIGCDPRKIGDGNCQQECAHGTTGNDGGDCDLFPVQCKTESLGNGICNFECNKAIHYYDKGDCCLPGDMVHKTCIDPSKPMRSYIDIDEFKTMANLDNYHHINIFFATWNLVKFVGISTFPWEKKVYGVLGGTVVHPEIFGMPGKTEGLVHEIGHNLGLWHVHHGLSELDRELACNDPCKEIKPSMTLGDMCSDTNPTVANHKCRDPDPTEGVCGVNTFKNTPYNNYMSYANDACTDHFSPQQIARMHCYLDLVYQPLREMKTPASIPLAPRIISADLDSIHIAWLEPLGAGGLRSDPVCGACERDRRMRQYASGATSSYSTTLEFWKAEEATGPPDAEPCEMSVKAWMPDTLKCRTNDCWLELQFPFPVIPHRLVLWVVHIDAGEFLDVLFVPDDGTSGPSVRVTANCDIMTTLRVNTNKVVSKVRVFVSSPSVAIDAGELISQPDHPDCLLCKTTKYKIIRDPPLRSGFVVTADTEFNDGELELGTTYAYRVQVMSENRYSELSPELVYIHGDPFCGDGRVDSILGEECDDKNARDGDGCSIDCSVEKGYHCKGSQSLCYRHKGDGVCETFELDANEKDCGFYTPKGYIDQWASEVEVNPQYADTKCPETVTLGEPSRYQKCGMTFESKEAWAPCKTDANIGDVWITLSVPRPVVAVAVIVYLGSDGKSDFSPEAKSIYVDLIDPEGNIIKEHQTERFVDCKENPLVIPIAKDLSIKFVLTKGVRIRFSYFNISISGLKVRSSNALNPVMISSCRDQELYDPRTGRCVPSTCSSHSNCDDFMIKYGVADCSGNHDGAVCKITCNDGYFVQGGNNEAVCSQGKWQSSGPHHCSPMDCRKPSIPLATVSCPDGTTFGKECNFKCDQPAVLRGTGTTLTCLANGTWSVPKTFCLVVCDPLPVYALVQAELRTLSCSSGEQLVGQHCRIRCLEGYHIEEESMKKKTSKFVCGLDGYWYGPRCIRNSCPLVPMVFSGAYTCTDGLFVGSICTMNCPGNIQIIKCDPDGDWDGAFDLCPAVAFLNCPQISSRSDLIFSCDSHRVGSTCGVRCKGYDSLPTYDGTDFSIDAGDKVDAITCTASLSWLPAPSDIVCERTCVKGAIGDKFCDGINNREFCDWDGGDCCPSTSGARVISLDDSCTTDCKCKDPMAIENKRRRRRHDKLKFIRINLDKDIDSNE